MPYECKCDEPSLETTSEHSFCLECGGVPPRTNTKRWEDELFELSEKHCKHDDSELNGCLFYIFKPHIEKWRKEAYQKGREDGYMAGKNSIFETNGLRDLTQNQGEEHG